MIYNSDGTSQELTKCQFANTIVIVAEDYFSRIKSVMTVLKWN